MVQKQEELLDELAKIYKEREELKELEEKLVALLCKERQPEKHKYLDKPE